MEAVLDFLTDHMVELVACFKHIAFKEDEEWRLLVVADTVYAGEGLSLRCRGRWCSSPGSHAR